MRVLFTTTEGSGHLHPLVPVADALRAAGHDVAFACDSAIAATVEGIGFPVFPTGGTVDNDPAVQQVLARMQQLPHGYERVTLAFFNLKPRPMLPDLAEMHALPSVERAVDVLEKLAAEKTRRSTGVSRIGGALHCASATKRSKLVL